MKSMRALVFLLPAAVIAIVLIGPGVSDLGGQGAPQNLQVLGGVDSEQLAAIMEATSASLGVECAYCHVEGAFASDANPVKQTARNMMRMVVAMSEPGRGTFELLDSPSCWTCHRGGTQPPIAPVAAPFAGPASLPVPDVFSASRQPAGDVYQNVTAFADLPASDLRDVMNSFRYALGVGCDHCHVPGDWSADDRIEKLMARVMVDMNWNLQSDYFMGRTAVTCWTCHRGQTIPETSLPASLVPPE